MLLAALLTFSFAVSAEDAPAISKPLLAHWTFDEDSGSACRDASGNSCDATFDGGVQRVRGVLQNALAFSGNHRLKVADKLTFANLSKISLSAWTMPTDLSSYREIFRKEDGDQRILFSYQDNGVILSLGLNINGYVECDAKIDPRQVMDGMWHHCAATFDGEWMRIYLDGKEIGSLKRPGPIRIGGIAPGCIASMNGHECFQGQLDDLRIYSEALSAVEIAALYQQGSATILQQLKEQDELAKTIYEPGKSFAETLAACAKRAAERGVAIGRETADVVQRRLKVEFSQDYDAFIRITGKPPAQLLLSPDPVWAEKEAERIVVLLAEFKPLTDQQWKRQTPAQLQQWKEIEVFETRLKDLKARSAARPLAETLQLVLDAGPRVQLRPYINEAVAPYVTPSTPETRNLTAAEARAALERDWLFQAENNPTPDRIAKELQWTRQLATRIAAKFPGKVDFTKELAELEQLEKRAAQLSSPDQPLYLAVRDLKRRILFANPALDFDKLVFVDTPYPQGNEWQHETRHRLGYMAIPGARLLTLAGLTPDGTLKQLMPQAPLHGFFWRPDVSYDGKRVLFCFKPHNEKSFHIYEINANGSGFHQITDGIYDDLDPIYLPDDRNILFSSTRGHTYVRCMPPTNAFVLTRCGLDGENMYLLSANNEPDYLPSVMNDGRVIYTRWEYTDKPLWRAQKLWTIHPDGTQVNMFWGNQSVWPDVLKDARNIPGSRRVMFTGCGHHDWFAGCIGILDPDKGLNFPNGLTKVTADVVWPECGNGPVDPVESPNYHASGRFDAYFSPYPLGDHDFLVSARRNGKYALYLMDTDGNRELIYEGTHHIMHAMPLKARARPTIMPDAVEWPSEKDRLTPRDGVIYSGDVCQGAPEELRGKVKFLRILSTDHKTYTYWHKRPYLSTGPVVSGVQSEGVKRFIGTVPVNEDGSVAFHAPAGIPIFFQLLDEQQRALHTMRSFVNVMPGEHRGCVGCHELHSSAPEARPRSWAVRKEPYRITPPPWKDNTVSYARYVRPVLDKYCGKCHQGDGKGRKKFDLTPRSGFLGFDETYWTLIGRPSWGKPYEQPKNPPPGWGYADMIMVEAFDQRDPAAYQTPKPMTRLSYKSRLIELASSGKHHDVRVDEESLLRLKVWVDAMCPYLGEDEVRAIPDPDFQGIDWLAVRPLIQNAPRIVRPGPLDASP
jgi:hypothetical protein